jgi:hypothetical protein
VSNVELNRGFFQNPRVDRLLIAATVATDFTFLKDVSRTPPDGRAAP